MCINDVLAAGAVVSVQEKEGADNPASGEIERERRTFVRTLLTAVMVYLISS
jgi:hypothetical protein